MQLPNIKGQYKYNYDLSNLTRLKVGGFAEALFKPYDKIDLVYFLQNIDSSIPIFTIGAGSNLLVRDGGVAGIIIKLSSKFNYIYLEDDTITAGSATLDTALSWFCHENGISGFEFLVGIPGTIGGGIIMNAGAYGREFKNIIKSITAVDTKGKIHYFTNQEIGFKYRGTDLPDNLIIIEACFHCNAKENQQIIKTKMQEIMETRERTQPIKEKTAGCTFANPENCSAWQIINEVGLKGYSIGGAQFSEKHSNFIVNTGGATAKDIETLGELARKKAKEIKNIELKWEIKKIGKYDK